MLPTAVRRNALLGAPWHRLRWKHARLGQKNFTVSLRVRCSQYHQGLVATRHDIHLQWFKALRPNAHFEWQCIGSIE